VRASFPTKKSFDGDTTQFWNRQKRIFAPGARERKLVSVDHSSNELRRDFQTVRGDVPATRPNWGPSAAASAERRVPSSILGGVTLESVT